MSSIVDSKRDVVTTIGAYTSLNLAPTPSSQTNTLPSVNNSSEPLPFLIDILKVIVGSEALKDLSGRMLTEIVDETNPQAETLMLNQTTQYNYDDTLPSNFTSNVGVDIPMSNIDLYGKFKTNPTSGVGQLIYGDDADSFDYKVYEAISAEGTDIPFSNVFIRYDSNTETINVRNSSAAPNVGTFFTEFVDDVEFINKKMFVSNVLDAMYGTITANSDKSIEEIFNQQKITRLIDNAISGDESFELSDDELNELYELSENLKNGVIRYDFGCGLMDIQQDFDEFSTLVNEINQSNDQFVVSNKLVDSIMNVDDDMVDDNKETIKDGFFTRLIRLIKNIIIQSLIATPTVRFILYLFDLFTGNNTQQTTNVSDAFKNIKVFINCVIDDINKVINEFIYKIIIVVLTALIKPVVRQIIREKINNYIRVLKSLIGT